MVNNPCNTFEGNALNKYYKDMFYDSKIYKEEEVIVRVMNNISKDEKVEVENAQYCTFMRTRFLREAMIHMYNSTIYGVQCEIPVDTDSKVRYKLTVMYAGYYIDILLKKELFEVAQDIYMCLMKEGMNIKQCSVNRYERDKAIEGLLLGMSRSIK